MRRRPPHIPQRRPIYVGCEGASEVGYASFLQDLIRDSNLPVHLIIEELGPGAGDPLARINKAVQRLSVLRRTRTTPRERFALLDHDQAERDLNRANQALRIASDNDITIIWQIPCFEAVLLRHMPGRSGNRPIDTPTACRELRRDWPEYTKPMTRMELARRIDRAAVLRTAAVEPGLECLLRCIGLI